MELEFAPTTAAMILRTCAQVPAKAIDNDTEAILDNFFSSILDPSVELVSHAPEGINGVVRTLAVAPRCRLSELIGRADRSWPTPWSTAGSLARPSPFRWTA